MELSSKGASGHLVLGLPTAIVAGLIFWLTVALVLGMSLERERRQAIEHERAAMARIATVVEENTARTFDSLDIALSAIAAQVARQDVPAHDPKLRALMRAQLERLPTVRALFVIGSDGWILHDTDHPGTPNVSLADREYFRQYLAQPGLQHALSEAIQSRSGTGWFLASTRRITAEDGAFKGIVVAAVQLDWLPRLFTRLELQAGQSLSLLQADGRMLARFPIADHLVGESYARQRVFAEIARGSRAGVYETDGAPLGYPRIVGYRALDTQPLVVVLTMPLRTALAAWHRTLAGALVGLAVLTVLIVLGVTFFLQRQAEARRALGHRIAQAKAAAAAEANAKFRTFFERGCFFSCVLSPVGTVLEANEAGLEVCGIDRQDVADKKLWECSWWGPGTFEASLRDAIDAAAKGATVSTEAAYRRADGAATLVELVITPIQDSVGKVLFLAVLGVDITQRKHQEERLRALADELSRADRLKGEFLATFSHELRNVLAPLQNGVAILERAEPGSMTAVRVREVFKKQLEYMRNLVDDLLDVSRVSAGKVRLERLPLDLREVLSATAEAVRTFVEEPGHQFTMSRNDEPLPVVADRGRLQQVFVNLLINAAKYTPPGGHIHLRARREGAEIVVDVTDDGIGIPVHAQSKVFDMFEQVGENLARAQGGLGIGLAIVQKLVSLHGGHVEAFSEGEHRGSTFTVYLPAAELPPAAAEPAEAASAPPSAPPATPYSTGRPPR